MHRAPAPEVTPAAGIRTQASPWRVAAAIAMLAVGVSILTVAMRDNLAANRDFICYWAAGQQLIHHQNPYDGQAILRLERSAGLAGNRPFLMRNPPSALFLTIPLGLVNVRGGAVLWSLGLISAMMLSIRLLWIMQGRPEGRLHLIGYIFPPALASLLAGQVGAFLLLGVTLFLYFRSTRPYFAGASLLFCSIKPHLFLPLGAALIAWVLWRKAYPILFGTAIAVLASVGLSLVLNPTVWSQYIHGERGENIQNLFIPCVSVLFRIAVHRNAVWLQFLPAVAGCLWAIWYFFTRRDSWNWHEQGSTLLLVSVLVAPYAWFTDETVLLPAILVALYRTSDAGRSLLPFGCIAGVALIEIFGGLPLASGLYIWTAPVWLAWYLYAVRGTRLPSSLAD